MDQRNEFDEVPDEDTPQKDNRIISRMTLIFAIVVLAAIAFVIILMAQ